MTNATLLPFQPDAMTPAQLAAVSYLARYTGATHRLYAHQLLRWFTWCETNGLDPLVGLQRAHLVPTWHQRAPRLRGRRRPDRRTTPTPCGDTASCT